MIAADPQTKENVGIWQNPLSPIVQIWGRTIASMRRVVWVLLLLAILSANWFAYQTFLVSQNGNFTPNWGSAQWIQPQTGKAPVAYYRYSTSLNSLPDSAFVTIAASQVFRLYVNGTYIGTNYSDFMQGIYPRTYIYDILSALSSGPNVIAVRVANVDENIPGVRINLGFSYGNAIYYRGSGNGWIATFNSAAVYPRYTTFLRAWSMKDFDASSWLPVRVMQSPPVTPALTVNPLLYEHPIAINWVSAGSGHEAYFTRKFIVPVGLTGAWLRVAATGVADIYVNGSQFIVWNGQPVITDQNLADYLSDPGSTENVPQYRSGLILGVYNIAAYLHPGVNTIAIHVLSPGIDASIVGLNSLNAAMTCDMLFSDFIGRNYWVPADSSWSVSNVATPGWQQGNLESGQWHTPVMIERPGAVRALYLPDNTTVRSEQIVPLSLLAIIVFIGTVGVIALWLAMSFFAVRSYYTKRLDALETMSLGFVPAIALEALLLILSREPQMPQPFPYTWFWGGILLLVLGISYFFLWLNARTRFQQNTTGSTKSLWSFAKPPVVIDTVRNGLLKLYKKVPDTRSTVLQSEWRQKPLRWLQEYWILILIIIVAIPLIGYNLGYEPYWQDELASYDAAQGILAHGLPYFYSGFLYTKAELFSYMLALWTALFGTQQGSPRLISAAEYLLSIPLIYYVGCQFFNKRIALIAAAMLAFSPVTLTWGRQMRMYEQAQLITLLVCLLFYKALLNPRKKLPVYLAAITLVVDYLSHEEIFIILPAVLLCVLIFSMDKKRRLPSVLLQKHWWGAAAICVVIIGSQLLAAKFTPPPLLGTDSSRRPLVQFTTDNLVYYTKLLFFPQALGKGTLPWITLDSLLAIMGCFWALRTKNWRIKYCAMFLILSLGTLILGFTMEADRYIYPVLPLYYLLAAYALVNLLQIIWDFARPRIVLPLSANHAQPVFGGYLSRGMRMFVIYTVAICYLSILIAPVFPLSNYNLFVTRVLGFSYHRHYPDYDALGQYMKRHMQPGDIVIAVSPAISVRYYVGHVDYFFSIDRSLFIFEQQGHIVETASGAQAILSQNDLNAVLEKYKRVWIISDNGSYQAAVAQRFRFPPDFHIVFEGYGSAVYFRGD
jgi:hypothetical protein